MHDAEVAEHRTLGMPGGARGIKDRRGVVFLHGNHLAPRVFEQPVEIMNGDPRRRLGQAIGQLGLVNN